MNLAEKIYHCPVCISYSRKLGGKNSAEFMSIGIEQIIRQQVNEQDVEDYKSYFYRVLLNVRNQYYKRKDNKHLSFNENEEDEDRIKLLATKEIKQDTYKEALNEFLNKDFKNEDLKFYQDLIYLSLSNTKFYLAEKLQIRRADLDQHLKFAYQLIKKEHERIVS